MTGRRGFFLGLGAAFAGRALARRAMLRQLRRSVASLNEGDYGPLLSTYAPDAVLRFTGGPHRWAGEHRGRDAIERFLQEFTRAGLRGELIDAWFAGPPWAMTLIARFDDEARSPDGELLYGNRVAMVIRTRWGRIVEHEDFYEDTGRIDAFELALRERGVEPASPAGGATRP